MEKQLVNGSAYAGVTCGLEIVSKFIKNPRIAFQMFLVIRAHYHGQEYLDRDHILQLWTVGVSLIKLTGINMLSDVSFPIYRILYLHNCNSYCALIAPFVGDNL